jgi:hypothetical protein
MTKGGADLASCPQQLPLAGLWLETSLLILPTHNSLGVFNQNLILTGICSSIPFLGVFRKAQRTIYSGF